MHLLFVRLLPSLSSIFTHGAIESEAANDAAPELHDCPEPQAARTLEDMIQLQVSNKQTVTLLRLVHHTGLNGSYTCDSHVIQGRVTHTCEIDDSWGPSCHTHVSWRPDDSDPGLFSSDMFLCSFQRSFFAVSLLVVSCPWRHPDCCPSSGCTFSTIQIAPPPRSWSWARARSTRTGCQIRSSAARRPSVSKRVHELPF